MTTKLKAGRTELATHSPESGTWGTTSYFSRMSGADHETAAYWTRVVHRPAHRVSHQYRSIEGCPGCAYERAVA